MSNSKECSEIDCAKREVLSLCTEDEFHLWEILSHLQKTTRRDKKSSISLAKTAVGQLEIDNLVTVVQRDSSGLESRFDVAQAAAEHWTQEGGNSVFCFATEYGKQEYFLQRCGSGEA